MLGASVYGGATPADVHEVRVSSSVAVLLVPNHAHGPLADAGTWGAAARAIDRRRIERAGIEASATVGELTAGPLPAAHAPSGRVVLRMPVRSGDDFARRLADALSGPLDEAGFALRVETVSSEAYEATLRGQAWDLRVVEVVPPYESGEGLAGAALAAVGDHDEAKQLVLDGGLADAAVAARHASSLRVLVLGRRTALFHHRSALAGLAPSAALAIPFEALHFARTAESAP